MSNTHYFVTGTDTGVGKTVVSMLLMRTLYGAGKRPFYYKPVQTGCRTAQSADSDALFVYEHCPQLKGQDPGQSVGVMYAAPKAPLFAARDEGREVDVEGGYDMVRAVCSQHECVVFEGAGGVFVPVTRTLLMADLMHTVSESMPVGDALKTLVVARAGLGTINHTLLTLEALNQRKVPVDGVVMVQADGTITAPALLAENIEAIELFSGVRVWGVLPLLENMSAFSPEADELFRRIAG